MSAFRSIARGSMIVAMLTACAVAQPPEQSSSSAELAQVPKSLEQGKVDRPLRQKLAAEFANNDPAAQLALAAKLREMASSENDTTAKWVYLREARDAAVNGSDFSLAIAIIDDMAAAFAIHVEEMKAEAISIGLDKSQVPKEQLFASYLKLANECLDNWNLDLAHKSAFMARKAAGVDRAMIAQADALDHAARLKNHTLIQVLQAEKKLGHTPDDPQSNQIVGRHLCFNQGRWEIGLPYLARGGGKAGDLAARDLANPNDPLEMLKVADGWWDFVDTRNDVGLGAARSRAAYWYKKALPSLTEPNKSDAAKKLAEFEGSAPKAKQ